MRRASGRTLIYFMITVVYTHCPAPLSSNDFHALLRRLPPSQQARVQRYVRWQDQHTCLFSRLLVQYALRTIGETRDLLATWQLDAQGRPYVNAALDFNIAHSETCAMCALTQQGRVGLDIEYQRPLEWQGFQRIMSSAQWDSLHASTDALSLFYQWWTLKESVAKADGRGLSLGLAQIEEAPAGEVWLAQQRWFVQPLQLAIPSYQCYLASSEAFPVTLREITVAEQLATFI